jgi:hypothetical protein
LQCQCCKNSQQSKSKNKAKKQQSRPWDPGTLALGLKLLLVFAKILNITLVFEKNANFFAKNCRKSQKIVIITSTPGMAVASPLGSIWGCEIESGQGIGR